MISKINKIKNLGSVFCDYSCPQQLPNFKRFNLIYGWNASGKTTLSRLFDAIGGSKNEASLEYEIEDDQAKKYKQDEPFPRKLRVFNQDYIKSNIKILEGRANSITILLGKENKELVEQIQVDDILLNGDPKDAEKIGKIALLAATRKEKEQKDKERGSKFTEIAKTIGAAIGGYTRRDYRKPQAENDFSKLKGKEILEEDLEKYSLSVKQESLPIIDNPTLNKISINGKEVEVPTALQDVLTEAKDILKKTVKSEVIPRLAENTDISEWVEQGIHLHEKHKSTECEYCLQKIPQKRIDQLMRHFNEEDKKIKARIDELLNHLEEITSAIESIETKDKANLYEELRTSYSATQTQFNDLKGNLLKEINLFKDEIKAKKLKTMESVNLKSSPVMTAFIGKIKELGKIIDEHNKKSADFHQVIDDAVIKLKNHYLSTIYDDVKSLDTTITELNDKMKKTENGDPGIPGDLSIQAIKDRIAESRAKISSTHKAAEDINEGLKKFLGHDELRFEPFKEKVVDDSGEEKDVDGGYRIMRGEEQATSLSEGEKTAIAFVYFTVALKDAEFNHKEGIVVIDDPISSLDANLLFRVCSYIQTQLKSVGQLFLFTHNYDFFNQMKKWFINDLNREDKKTGPEGEFFMLTNKYDNGQKCRVAILSQLDDLLKDYESEYHYLFKKLLSFEEDNPAGGPATLKAVYDYPNLARKMLECFLSFRVPKKGSFYTRLMGLNKINKEISSDDLNYVYSFVNSHSHLDTKNGLIQFDPTLTLSGPDCIKALLKIVEQADEKHFKSMKNAVNPVQ